MYLFLVISKYSLSIYNSPGICRICDLQVLKDIWRHFATDASYFRPYAETKNNGGERKVCINGFNLGLGSDHEALKSQVLYAEVFSLF